MYLISHLFLFHPSALSQQKPSSIQNKPKKIKIQSKSDKGYPRYFIEEYTSAPKFESLYTLVRHYQRVPFSVEKVNMMLKRPIEEPRNFAKETYVCK